MQGLTKIYMIDRILGLFGWLFRDGLKSIPTILAEPMALDLGYSEASPRSIL